MISGNKDDAVGCARPLEFSHKRKSILNFVMNQAKIVPVLNPANIFDIHGAFFVVIDVETIFWHVEVIICRIYIDIVHTKDQVADSKVTTAGIIVSATDARVGLDAVRISSVTPFASGIA